MKDDATHISPSRACEIHEADLAEMTRQREALAAALEAMCKWIGPPPVDRYSFDSAREDAWKASRAALRAAGRLP